MRALLSTSLALLFFAADPGWLAVAGGAAGPGGSSGVARAASPRAPLCTGRPHVRSLYALGSSTMGMSLGKILRAQLKPLGVRVRVWGKASSGLARPDFHDWPAAAARAMAEHKPQLAVVSLGTNDGQNLYRKGRWYQFGSALWRRFYAARVDAMLDALTGPGHRRPVLWLGPTALPSKRGRAKMRAITDLMARRVARYATKHHAHVTFVDGLRLTTDAHGAVREWVRPPGAKKARRARAAGAVHLNPTGVRWLLAAPLLKDLRACLPSAPKAASGRARPQTPGTRG